MLPTFCAVRSKISAAIVPLQVPQAYTIRPHAAGLDSCQRLFIHSRNFRARTRRGPNVSELPSGPRRLPMVHRLAIPVLAALTALGLAVSPADAQSPKRGGILRIADREAPNLDPHLSVSFLTHSWANMVYSQLVRFAHGPEQKHSADHTIVPDLAERWEYKTPTV